MSSADGCLLSLSSTALRTPGRLAAEIRLLTESFNEYACRKHGWLKIHSLVSWNCFWRDGGPLFRLLTLSFGSPLLLNWYIIYLKYSLNIKRMFSNTLWEQSSFSSIGKSRKTKEKGEKGCIPLRRADLRTLIDPSLSSLLLNHMGITSEAKAANGHHQLLNLRSIWS